MVRNGGVIVFALEAVEGVEDMLTAIAGLVSYEVLGSEVIDGVQCFAVKRTNRRRFASKKRFDSAIQ